MNFTVYSKNRATGEQKIVWTGLSADKADRLAIRCSLCESNPDVIYRVR